MTRKDFYISIGLDESADYTKTFYEILNAYRDFCKTLHTTPDSSFTYPKEGTIFDKTKTVIWNENEVKRLRNEYTKEQKRLNKLKTEYDNSFIDVLIFFATDTVQNSESLTDNQIKLCFDRAYDVAHSAGFEEIYAYMIDYLCFALDIIETM